MGQLTGCSVRRHGRGLLVGHPCKSMLADGVNASVIMQMGVNLLACSGFSLAALCVASTVEAESCSGARDTCRLGAQTTCHHGQECEQDRAQTVVLTLERCTQGIGALCHAWTLKRV